MKKQKQSVVSMPVYEITTSSGYRFLSLNHAFFEGDSYKIIGTIWDVIYKAKLKEISQEDTAYLLDQMTTLANNFQSIVGLTASEGK